MVQPRGADGSRQRMPLTGSLGALAATHTSGDLSSRRGGSASDARYRDSIGRRRGSVRRHSVIERGSIRVSKRGSVGRYQRHPSREPTVCVAVLLEASNAQSDVHRLPVVEEHLAPLLDGVESDEQQPVAHLLDLRIRLRRMVGH